MNLTKYLVWLIARINNFKVKVMPTTRRYVRDRTNFCSQILLHFSTSRQSEAFSPFPVQNIYKKWAAHFFSSKHTKCIGKFKFLKVSGDG